MNVSKMAMFLIMSGLIAPAFADDNSATSVAGQAQVETYTYQTTLDIKKVLAATDLSGQCGPAPVQMTYLDSHNQQHVIEYQGMGIDCSNG